MPPLVLDGAGHHAQAPVSLINPPARDRITALSAPASLRDTMNADCEG